MFSVEAVNDYVTNFNISTIKGCMGDLEICLLLLTQTRFFKSCGSFKNKYYIKSGMIEMLISAIRCALKSRIIYNVTASNTRFCAGERWKNLEIY